MIGIEIKDVKTVQNRFKKEIEEHRTLALAELIDIEKKVFNLDERNYLASVILEFAKPDFLFSEPSELDRLASTIGKIPPNSQAKGRKTLNNCIIGALAYRELRTSFYPQYFSEIGIKACVYCNSQLTVTIAKSKKKIVARFDVDHYRPKDDYPFLAISLFNLYPVCASCNRVKSTREVHFELYTNGIKKSSDFKFELDKTTKAKYFTNFDANEIEFKFIEPKPPNANFKRLEEVFSIQAIHDTQKDVIGELMIKSHIYNAANKEQMRESFKNISLDEKLFERVILGNYVEDKDIHKRPFSKLMMDIARDLHIID
jgi:hypothetical protein